jgi:hypothetical protein
MGYRARAGRQRAGATSVEAFALHSPFRAIVNLRLLASALDIHGEPLAGAAWSKYNRNLKDL